jgi:hypothetical protein
MMIELTMRKVSRWAAAVAVVPLFAIGGSANAVVFVANWDPLFNQAFTDFTGVDLAWVGSATFDVATPCVAPSTTPFPDGAGGAGASLVGFAFPDSVRFDSSGIMDGLTLPGLFQLNQGGPITMGGSSFDIFLDFVINANYSGPELTVVLTSCEGICTYVSDTSGDPGPFTPHVTFAVVSPVPEPATLVLTGIGLLAAGAVRRRRST